MDPEHEAIFPQNPITLVSYPIHQARLLYPRKQKSANAQYAKKDHRREKSASCFHRQLHGQARSGPMLGADTDRGAETLYMVPKGRPTEPYPS